jgi:hypothetical protein
LTELESSTEEIAVEEDSQELKFSLVMNCVDKLNQDALTENGIKLNAKSQFSVKKLDL